MIYVTKNAEPSYYESGKLSLSCRRCGNSLLKEVASYEGIGRKDIRVLECVDCGETLDACSNRLKKVKVTKHSTAHTLFV